MSDHPITPPPELVKQWRNSWQHGHGEFGVYIATQAARWGADQELEACCAAEQAAYGKREADWLRSFRRPNPPSLAEQAFKALLHMDQGQHNERAHTIRRALERLQELENNG